jgi:hypothetical protein
MAQRRQQWEVPDPRAIYGKIGVSKISCTTLGGCRYVELCLVRAGMVRHPRDDRRSSFRAHADGKIEPLVSA